MSRGTKLSRLPFILSSALMALIIPAALPQALTTDQIIEKNIAARGGLKAWREIQIMTMTGKMDAGSRKNVQLPFVLKLKRPQMSRLEIEFAGKKALNLVAPVPQSAAQALPGNLNPKEAAGEKDR